MQTVSLLVQRSRVTADVSMRALAAEVSFGTSFYYAWDGAEPLGWDLISDIFLVLFFVFACVILLTQLGAIIVEARECCFYVWLRYLFF